MINYSSVKYSGVLSIVDSDYIIARVTDTIDSAISGTIDSDYINSRVVISTDSNTTISIISEIVDSDYVRTRQDFRYGSLTNRPLFVISDDSTSTDVFSIYMIDSSGNDGLTPVISSSKLFFQPSTGQLTATTFNSLSDITFKEEISSIDNVFELLNKINPVKFNWKDNGKRSYGVIAQDLEQEFPELVATTKGVKTVQYTPLIALLVEAIKELKKQIDNK